MLSDNEYHVIIYENVRYISEHIKYEQVVYIDNKFRETFLKKPFPRDLILEYIKYICVQIDKNKTFDDKNILCIFIAIYNLIIKYYIDVSVYNIDICNYFEVDIKIFNEIEMNILKLLDFNLNFVNIEKWIEI